MMQRRIAAGVLLAIVIGAGLIVHGVLPESAFTDIAGDALYVAAAYLALVLVFPRLPPWVTGGIVLVWCVGVELLQLTNVPHQIVAVFPPAVLLLGSTFDARDLLVYAIAALMITGIDEVRARRGRPAP